MNSVPALAVFAVLSLGTTALAQEAETSGGEDALTALPRVAQAEVSAPATSSAPLNDYQEPPPQEAKTKTGLHVTGSFFTRYELREGYDDVGRFHPRYRESDFVYYRARLGLTTDPIDVGNGRLVTLKLEPQSSGVWADKPNTLTDGNLNIHQATLRIAKDDYWIDVGRFEMAYGEHVVIGNVGWHQTGRSFDGIRSRISLRRGWVDVFATQVLEDPFEVTPFAAGDKYFSGIYAGLGSMLGTDVDFDVYLLNHITPRIDSTSELGTQFTAGSRYKRDFGTMDVRAEGGVQVGTGGSEQFAVQALGEVGTMVGTTRLAAQGWYASGDDPNTAKNEGWDQLYPTAHKFMGLADIAGDRTNIMGGMLRVRHPQDDINLGADAHLFLRPQTPDGVDSLTAVEVDAWALWKLGTGLGLRCGYSIYAPFADGVHGTSDLAHYLEIQLAYALK